MKTDIYGLFGMIKDGKAPTKIKYLDKVYKFVGEDYEDEEGNQLLSWLFQDYCVDYLLSAEIEILETTITYKQDNYIQYQPYTGEAEIKCNSPKYILESDKTYKFDKIEKLGFENCTTPTSANENEAFLMTCINFSSIKIDELIDKVNKINKIIDKLNGE